MYVIGIDFSTDKKKRGLTIAEYSNQLITTHYCGLINQKEISKVIETKEDLLFAIDAPLGWPKMMGVELKTHKAGEFIKTESNALFRRLTDEVVKKHTGKNPMDVGADRIARTAHSALEFLEDIRMEFNTDIPLAWNKDEFVNQQTQTIRAIEVYPAVTLKQRGWPYQGYKGSMEGDEKNRKTLRSKIRLELASDVLIPNNDDVIDSSICVIAAVDFLNDLCITPKKDEIDSAKKEGWIWFRAKA